MSNRVGKFVDVEKLIVDWLEWYLPTVRSTAVLPNPIPNAGVLWVSVVGGASDYDQARPRVDVQTLVPGVLGAASALAGLGHEAMGALGDEQVINGQLIHKVKCLSLPTRHYWSDEVDRFVATYLLDLPVL